MSDIRPMDESYIHVDCLHHGPVDPAQAPRRGGLYKEVRDLPPHPWSDETIATLAGEHQCISEGWRGDASREFMREMVQRYGTCAILAWEDGKVVGQLRFYPLQIAQLLAREGGSRQPAPSASALADEPDPGTLWVQCVMTSRPFTDPTESASGGPASQSMGSGGARRGTGQALVRALVDWASRRGWERIVKRAHADLDCMYGNYGGGGKRFWEKAGFRCIRAEPHEPFGDDAWQRTVAAQAEAKGMPLREAWSWYHMARDLAHP